MMQINLVAQATRVEILRPCRMEEAQCVVFGQGPMHTLFFSRSEWALLVMSGLWDAITTLGWPVWDVVTAERAPNTREEDHLLVIASILARGHGFHMPEPVVEDQETAYARVRRALHAIYQAAESYRERTGISTPLDVFPEPYPSPSFQQPLLECAVEGTHIETLMDLAKHGEEATFKDLAQTLGVQAEKIDELWTGTVRRLSRGLE